jgi:hypothetical protein
MAEDAVQRNSFPIDQSSDGGAHQARVPPPPPRSRSSSRLRPTIGSDAGAVTGNGECREQPSRGGRLWRSPLRQLFSRLTGCLHLHLSISPLTLARGFTMRFPARMRRRLSQSVERRRLIALRMRIASSIPILQSHQLMRTPSGHVTCRLIALSSKQPNRRDRDLVPATEQTRRATALHSAQRVTFHPRHSLRTSKRP